MTLQEARKIASVWGCVVRSLKPDVFNRGLRERIAVSCADTVCKVLYGRAKFEELYKFDPDELFPSY